MSLQSLDVSTAPAYFSNLSRIIYKKTLIQYYFFATISDRLKNTITYSTPSPGASQQGSNAIMIIIADDDSDDRLLFTEAISEINTTIQIQSVDGGLPLMQLLTAANAALPDIIFLDLNMPGKNGKECLKEIKNNLRLKDVPVIIYSTSATTKDINDTHTAGANLYIRKPNTFTGLIEVIKKVFSLDLEQFTSTPAKNNFVLGMDLV